ncbi:MAG TPA: TonB-dependent receptor [Porphyromonadaceae bacterium]|nr:TonB-dependent receptor [Porphyromonadaceae bacterium]
MNPRSNLVKTILFTLFTLIAILSVYQVQAQNEYSFPAQTLMQRIDDISKLSKKQIAYDISRVEDVRVAAYSAATQNTEEWLDRSLKNTPFIYRKKADGNYYLVQRPQQTDTSEKGSLKGRIVEAETSEPLIGATVKIQGTQFGTITDMDGYYRLTGVPEGRHTLEVTYLGYTNEKVDVRVRASQTETYNVVLSPDSKMLQEVIVSGVRRERGSVPHATVQQVVQEIKELQVVASGISSEQISKSADRNAADAVAKVAGVSIRDNKFVVVRGMNERYNLTYLNDNVAPSTEIYSRAFALNLLPTRIIDKILVYKSPSPDLLGDMTGGVVKVYTKDATAVKHFDLDIQLGVRESTTFNHNFLTYKGGKYDFLGFDDGTRALPKTVPGYGDFTKANISQKTYAESFGNILQYGKIKALPDIQMTANYYDAWNVFGKTLSMLSSFSYKKESKHWTTERRQGFTISAQNVQALNKMYNDNINEDNAQMSLLQNFTLRLNDNHRIRFNNFLLQQGQDQVTTRLSAGPFVNQPGSDGEWVYDSSIRKQEKNTIFSYTQRFLYSSNLSGSHSFAGGKQSLDWNGGYIFTRQEIPDQRIMRFDNIDVSGGTYPVIFTDYNWTAIKRAEHYASGGNNLELGKISRSWTRNTEQAGNLSMDYKAQPLKWLRIKMGTYHQLKRRVLFRRVYTLNEGDLNENGSHAMGDDNAWIIGGSGNYMNYNLVYYREQDLGSVWSDTYLRDDGSALKVFDRTSGSDSYKAYEQLNSGYVMLNMQPFGDILDISGGVRLEYDRQRIASAISGSSSGYVNVPVYVDNKTADWLPSVNISFKPTAKWVLRAAYGETVNRTEFRESASFREMDYLNNQTITGNSDLTASNASNYDARLEWYPYGEKKSDLLSVGAFYKEIINPIERTIDKDLGNSKVIPVISFSNAKKAQIKGLEAELRKDLDFISGMFFRNLSVIANYSYLHSEVETPNGRYYNNETGENEFRYIKRALQGQAPHIFNAGIYYDNPGSGTKVAFIYNAVGERIYAASTGRTGSDSGGGNYDEAGYLGSQIELPSRQLDFSFSQRLATGWQLKFTVQNLLNAPVEIAEDSNFTYKYEKFEKDENNRYSNDIITNSYKPGRFFSLSVNYSF